MHTWRENQGSGPKCGSSEGDWVDSSRWWRNKFGRKWFLEISDGSVSTVFYIHNFRFDHWIYKVEVIGDLYKNNFSGLVSMKACWEWGWEEKRREGSGDMTLEICSKLGEKNQIWTEGWCGFSESWFFSFVSPWRLLYQDYILVERIQ